MGSGTKGLYKMRAYMLAVPGSTSYMPEDDRFFKYIRKRSDVDSDGYYDIIAHGSSKTIMIEHNGKQVEITHRAFARLIKNEGKLTGKPIRLLSCNTGHIPRGFAQGLADRLGVPIKAPTEYLWATQSGAHFIRKGKKVGKDLVPDYSQKKGDFKVFYPRGGKTV